MSENSSCLVFRTLHAPLCGNKSEYTETSFRISNPNYRADLMKRRRLLKTKKLQKRLSELPKPHDAKGIKQFVLNKFRRAVQLTCTIDGQEEAAENMADALCALSVSEADRILNCMKYHSKIERKTYDLMCEKYAEMKNFKISCMITNDNKPDRI